MSFKDELDEALSEKKKEDTKVLSDDKVYDFLINRMYEVLIKNAIKDEVVKGKTNIVGYFTLSFQTDLTEKFSWDKLSNHSSIYSRCAGYDSPDYCEFQKLYTYKTGFFKTHVSLTPLGERVYQDLKKLAKKDGVSLSEPYPETGNWGGSMKVKFEYQYK